MYIDENNGEEEPVRNIGKEETENTNHNTTLEWHFMDIILVMTLYGVPQSLSEHMYGVCYVA